MGFLLRETNTLDLEYSVLGVVFRALAFALEVPLWGMRRSKSKPIASRFAPCAGIPVGNREVLATSHGDGVDENASVL